MSVPVGNLDPEEVDGEEEEEEVDDPPLGRFDAGTPINLWPLPSFSLELMEPLLIVPE